MLIEFSVANFRSIKEKQTLSMVADKGFATGFNSVPYLSNIAAIYGANGSGKSNLVKAMEFFGDFVNNSAKASQEGEEIEVIPFLFSEKTQELPSEFEIIFIHNDYLFQYGFSLNKNIVITEWLYATPKDGKKQKFQTWLSRDMTIGEIEIDKKNIKGEKEFWKKSTRHNSLFLSTAVSLNSEDFKKPFDWIVKEFRVFPTDASISPRFTIKQIADGNKKEQILKFLKAFDTVFEDIKIVEEEFNEKKLPKGMPSEIKNEIMKNMKGEKTFDIYTSHKMEEGGVYYLDIGEESLGTEKLFAFAAPIIDVLENGYCLVVDEINNSLHPHALAGVINLFRNKKTNPKNAQLIFTSHDTLPMNILDREQIWVLDKGKFGNTNLTSIAEFKTSNRETEAIEKRYLNGRYSGIPNIGDII